MYGDQKKKVDTAPRRFAKRSSRNYTTYDEAKEAHTFTMEGKNPPERCRIRRRLKGFDVVIYKRLPEKKAD